jgi:hypothetical protein
MGSQDVTHNPAFYFSIGAQVLVTLVLLGLVIVGIVIAIRSKTGRGKGCGIVMAVADRLSYHLFRGPKQFLSRVMLEPGIKSSGLCG